MSYRILIRDTMTGEERWTEQAGDIDEEVCEFLWSEGNLSCDCNRELHFRRAGGEETSPDDAKCGEGRFVLAGSEPPREWADEVQA